MPGTIHKYVYTSYIVQAINVLVNFVYSLVIVRLLGAAGFGEFSLFSNSLAFFILLLGFNLPSVLVFFIANQRVSSGKLLFSSIAISLVTTLILVVVLLNSDTLGFSIHIFPGGQNKPIWIALFVMQFFLLQLNQLLTAFLNAHKIFIPISISVLVLNLLLLIFWTMFSLKLISTSSPLFDFIWWVNIIINATLTIYYVYLIVGRLYVHLKFVFLSWKEIRLVAGFAGIVYLCNTIQFLNYKMDVWFIHYFTGDKETGIYALALSLSQLIWILPNAVSGVLLNYYEVNKRERSLDLALHYGSISLYFSIITAFLMLGVFYFALPLIYGVQFTGVFFLCTILFLGTIPFSLAIIIANLNSGIGFVRINLYATLVTFVLGFLLDYILIPLYGLNGAAIAKVIIYVAGLVFHMVVGQFLYKLPWTRLFKRPNFRNLLRNDLLSS